MGWLLLGDTLTAGLAEAEVEIVSQVHELALGIAKDALEYAKQNAPWQDRTGDARAGLDVAVDEADDVVTIQLFHTVDYGLWLEVIQSGRFAIIMPTLERYAGPMLMHDAQSEGATQT